MKRNLMICFIRQSVNWKKKKDAGMRKREGEDEKGEKSHKRRLVISCGC
jgi:hypothetical protein